jgi:hypothetical protein
MTPEAAHVIWRSACTDAELTRIHHPARANETRLVITRRAIRPKRLQPPPLPGGGSGRNTVE